MNVMKTLGFLLASLPSSMALVTKHGGYRPQQTRVFGRQQTENFAVQSDDNNFLTRRRWMEELVTTGSVAAAAVIASTSLLPLPAFADVSDGTSLPQGAQQFSRVVRLKTDIIVSLKPKYLAIDRLDEITPETGRLIDFMLTLPNQNSFTFCFD